MVPDRKKAFINSVNLNADTGFPYLVLDVVNDRSYPKNPGFLVMHWHEDLQFIYVLEGEIEVRTLDEELKLAAGHGVFINKNVVHSVNQSGDCHYKSFIFPDYFLRFYFGSPAEHLVDSLVENMDVPLCRFIPGIGWCDTVLSILRKLSFLEKNGNEFYVYEVLVFLTSLWLEIRKNVSLPSGKKEKPVSRRMQRFLAYIEKHYGEGEGSGKRILNPQTIVYLEEGASIVMETSQIAGVDDTKRYTKVVAEGADSEVQITEKLLTDGEQHAISEMDVILNGAGSRTRVISRSVAKGSSTQLFYPRVQGNGPCFGHVSCDAIIMSAAKVRAIPEISCNHVEAQLIHEAAIGRIAGEQLLKLETLGLTPEEAEEKILEGFLR